MKSEKSPLLGILGGLGPMSSVYFYELLTSRTKAERDAEHIDLLLSSRASTPDRTAFLLGRSEESPLPIMREEVLRLCRAGADLIVIPCNTAHSFYRDLQKDCPVPILNIVSETVEHLFRQGIKTFGLLATEGTVLSGSYPHFCKEKGMVCIPPSPEEQALITSLIYDKIKQNKEVDERDLLSVVERMKSRGCERVVLGCTELSLIKRRVASDPSLVDSLEVLAYRTILSCKKTPVGFDDSFEPPKTEGVLS